MAGAFRDELEAARSRVEVLSEQNDELEKEIARLRGASELPRPAAQLSVDRAPDSLTERTLAVLDRLNEDADLALDPAPREDVATGADEAPRLPTRRASPRPSAGEPSARSSIDDKAWTQITLLESETRAAKRQLSEAATEREELREARRRAAARSVWIGIAIGFVAGLIVGILLGGAR